jgi:similar to stage IV sporulation protein
MGTVQARTWYTLTTAVPLTAAEKQYTGRRSTGVSLVFGTHRIKFFTNSSIEGREYDKITTRRPLRLLGLSLPVTLVTETRRFYETVPAERPAAQAAEDMEAVLTEYLHSIVDPYGSVKSTLCGTRQRGDTLLVTLTAECEEQIGERALILTEAGG